MKKALTPARGRQLVDEVRTIWKVSVRKACGALRIERSFYGYKSKRGDQAVLKHRIKEICETRGRLGYRRVPVLLGGKPQAGAPPLQGVGSAAEEQDAQAPGEGQAPGGPFGADADQSGLSDGLCSRPTGERPQATHSTILETYSRYSPATHARFSYQGQDVVQTLERVWREVGFPRTIRVDNGSQFISRDLDLWAYAHYVTMDFSRPGKPTDNAYIESFNGSLRAECLNTQVHEP